MVGLKFNVALLSLTLAVSAMADSDYEQTLVGAIVALNESKLTQSQSSLEALTSRYPNSKLGHLLLGDILAARAGLSDLDSRYADNPLQLTGLRDEMRYRLQSATTQTPATRGMVPAELIRSAPSVRYVLAADASLSRLYVFQNNDNSYQLVDDYFMTIGQQGMGKLKEGDLRTPEGVYFVTTYLDGEGLPPRYGPGAFPIDYPNDYDKNLRRTGYGIWIHGTEPENYNRVPLASDGCLSLSNNAFLDIKKYISTDGSTPVIISRKFNWRSPGEAIDTTASAEQAVSQWQHDSRSLDADRILSHYSAGEFNNFDQFAAGKRNVGKFFKQVRMSFNNLSIYTYPGDEKMMLVSFDQEYRDGGHTSTIHKKQYWKRYNERWQIIYEG